MAMLTRKDILSADDLKREKVMVPEWGDADSFVYVRGLSGREVDKLAENTIEQHGKKQTVKLSGLRARLCAMAVCDENGKPVFSAADVDALTEKSAAPMIRIFKVAQKLSNLGEDDIEDLADNLEADPSVASPSD